MDRDEWNKAFADRIHEQSGLGQNFAMESATNADESFARGEAPIDAADEELSSWSE